MTTCHILKLVCPRCGDGKLLKVDARTKILLGEYQAEAQQALDNLQELLGGKWRMTLVARETNFADATAGVTSDLDLEAVAAIVVSSDLDLKVVADVLLRMEGDG